jgi:hypothetical protein
VHSSHCGLCTDHSAAGAYTYDDSHARLLNLRERLWEGYLLGGFGEYIITDFLNANLTSCALEGTGCIDVAAFELDVYGVGAAPEITDEDAKGGGFGGVLPGG